MEGVAWEMFLQPGYEEEDSTSLAILVKFSNQELNLLKESGWKL